jgi:hypothetical protein
MRNLTNKSNIAIVLIVILFVFNVNLFAEDEPFGVYTNDDTASGGGVAFNFYPSGYSDGFWWGHTDRHPYTSHEMLSGEWAAALYWNQCGSNETRWLTDEFLYPYFSTNSIFEGYGSPPYDSWDDPNNPIDNYDTAYSAIQDSLGQDSVRIRIDYELVDLGEQDANGVGGSPISFIDSNGVTRYVYSERYILLQTYTIENISDSNITGLEFYQMLHAHPADNDDYSSYIANCSTYCNTAFDDPLESCTPYNSVHQVGNFRYDITQWNTESPIPYYPNHIDWISFSSTVEPTAVDSDVFYHTTNQTTGTYVNVTNRDLNNETYTENPAAAGAMQFDLPDLESNDTTSITFAIMYGVGPVQTIPSIDAEFTIVDDTNSCISPFYDELISDYLNYTIGYDSNSYSANDVNIICYLPDEADFNSCTGSGVYDESSHSVSWNIGTINPNDTDSFNLCVSPTQAAVPGSTITARIELYSGQYITAFATEQTPVCCWGGEIIYVDTDANGFENGTSWTDAFTDLNTALQHAGNLCTDTTAVWVAEGTYKPQPQTGSDPYQPYLDASFELPEDVGVFGHFAGWETSIDQRDFADANKETILDGQIEHPYYEAVGYLVTAENISDAVIDGFTIKNAYNSGVYLNDSYIGIANCKILGNSSYGIYTENYSYPDIHNCLFQDNYNGDIYSDTSQPDISYCIIDGNDICAQGVYLKGGSVSNLSNTHIKNHTGDGIYGDNATITLTNCRILKSNDNGIEGSNCDVTMQTSIFDECTDNAVYLKSYSDIDISKSVFKNSGEQGINLSQNSSTNILNSWIHNNGKDQVSLKAAGIYLYNQVGIPLVINNTIYDNYTYGIESSENGADPNIINCIITDNNSSDLYRENGDFDTVNYCLLQNAHNGLGNLTGVPGFKNVITNPNDLHLDETSQCKDAGDPNGDYQWQTDIDGENRVYYGRVDIGADEYYWSAADFDESGNVNFDDFAYLDNSWQITDANISLDDDNDIDADDLALFCQDWLWEKGWEQSWMITITMGMGDNLYERATPELQGELTTAEYPAERRNTLPITNLKQSLDTRPERMIAKTQRFYEISPASTAKTFEITKEDIEEILEFVDKIWQSGELDKTLTEQQYLDFRKAIEQSWSDTIR